MEENEPSVNLKSKKIKDYFLEFAMLFLAVTLGFFAESYREHLSDKSHERQLVRSLVEDLKSDTATIQLSIDFRAKKWKMIDSLMVLLESKQIKGNEGELYYFGRRLVRNFTFQSNERTLSQLDNSGAAGTIQNVKAMNGIIAYRKLVEIINKNQDDERLERQNAFPVLSRMFSPFEFNRMMTPTGVYRSMGNPALRTYDEALQQDLAFWAHQIKGSAYLIEGRLGLLKKQAKELIVLLEMEYELN